MSNESDNEDFFRRYQLKTVTIINCILNAPLMLLSILSNALVLAAIIRTPTIRSTPHMIILCGLAFSDLLVGFIAKPLFIAKELTSHQVLVNLVVLMGYSVCIISLCIITIISLDRFLVLHYHMTYATLVSTLRMKYTLGMIWLTNFLLSSFYFLNASAYFFMVASRTVNRLVRKELHLNPVVPNDRWKNKPINRAPET